MGTACMPDGSSPFRHAIPITTRGTMHDNNVYLVRDQGPLLFQLVGLAVESPVEKPRLPGRTPNPQTAIVRQLVLKINPGQVARDPVGRPLEDPVMVAGHTDDAPDMAQRFQPAAKVAVQPLGLEINRVIAEGTDVPG